MAKIRIGCSGWNYEGWKGSFYPEDLKSKDMLAEYLKHFDTVEINNTFYSLPDPDTAKAWYDHTPKKFVFAVKASGFITHRKKLKDPEYAAKKFFDMVENLDDKLGPILFQLPPNWKYNGERFEEFLKFLSKDFDYTFELRDESWLNDEAYELLAKYKMSLCFYDFKHVKAPEIVTGKFVYVRLHGPNKQAYGGSYSDAALSDYAAKMKNWEKKHKVYAYFDNDQKAQAPFDAKKLIDKL